MTKLITTIVFLISVTAGFSQQPAAGPSSGVIERVDISGIPESRLSTELRADIQKVAGQTYDAAVLNQLAEGIQIELPEYVAAVTTQPGTQPDRIRIVLVVAKISDNDALKTNINSRYIVDAVDVAGSYKAKISDGLKNDLQSMVGKNLDNARADELRGRILKENISDNDPEAVNVVRKLRRSNSPQHVKIIYEVDKPENRINFSASNGVYHSTQGFSIPGDFNAGWSTSMIPGSFNGTVKNDPHLLIERFAGWEAGYKFGRPWFRLSATYASYRAQWKENTLHAAKSSDAPGLYRLRDTIDTSARVTLPWQLKATGGVDFVELQMQSASTGLLTGFQKSRVLKGTLEGLHTSRKSDTRTDSHSFGWGYTVRTGTRALGSDFVYTRHELTAEYDYQASSKMKVGASFLAGRATGNAPMFERFSLGNAFRLRGWNKYELDPLGGNRVVYGSGYYKYSFVTGFYDMGAIWDARQPSITRQSAGFSLGFDQCKGAKRINPLCWVSVTVGFPINSNGAHPAIILGM